MTHPTGDNAPHSAPGDPTASPNLTGAAPTATTTGAGAANSPAPNNAPDVHGTPGMQGAPGIHGVSNTHSVPYGAPHAPAATPGFAPPPPPVPEPPRARRDDRLARLTPEATLRRLELQVTRRLDGLLNGQHLGLIPGPGTELAEARLYQPGEDDVRHMDWAVTARTTTPHVRDLIADHELEAWALVDLTPSMDFGTTDMTKRELAVAALAAIGFLTIRLGDRLGAHLLHPHGQRRWPSRTGKPAMYHLLRAILDAPPATTPPARRGDPAPPTADLATGITNLHRGQTRRGLRVVISDFLPPAAGPAPDPRQPPPWERPLRHLAARHQVLAVEIIDPRELDLPDIGLVEMTDPETGTVHEIVLNRRTRQRYAAAAAAQRAHTRDALRRAGAHHLVLRTDRDWITDIARFALRQRRAAGRTTPTTTTTTTATPGGRP